MSDPALWTNYPHSLYPFSDATGDISATPGHANSATIRAISLEKIRMYIVDAIVPSARPPHARAAPYRAQNTLNALMRTCSSFFAIAASVLWRHLDDIDVLWSVLMKNDGSLASGTIRLREMQRFETGPAFTSITL